MAIATVYTCDICKQSKSRNGLAKITVKSEGIKIKSAGHSIQIDICPDCLKKKGFVVECKDEEVEQAAARNQVTLEDKIYDILESLVVVFTE